MAYPDDYDNLADDWVNATDSDGNTVNGVGDHARMHNSAAASINAIQAEAGLTPSGAHATISARLDATDDYLENAAAPLAQSGQTPSESPVADQIGGAVGSLAIAARADHAHPIVWQYTLAGVGDWLEFSQMPNANLGATNEAREMAIPVPIYTQMTFDRIGVMHAGNGTTGALWRFGIRAYNATDPAFPGTLILDAGTVDATSGSPTVKAATINQMLTPGIYWLTVTIQGGATGKPNCQWASNPVMRAPGNIAAASGRYYTGAYQDSITGALPASFSIGGSQRLIDSACPWITLRRSA